MKTDKFENTIRQKLESISPDFQEDNWTKMQNYMQVHNPPTIWQQYGSWLGYAAAASVTSVMVFLYVNQLSQNNDLVADVTKLKSQIELISSTPSVVQKVDTIYIVQKEVTKDQFLHNQSEDFVATVQSQTVKAAGHSLNRNTEHKTLSTDNSALAQNNVKTNEHVKSPEMNEPQDVASGISTISKNTSQEQLAMHPNNGDAKGDVSPPAVFAKSLDNFSDLVEISPASIGEGGSRNLQYALASRLSPRQAKKVWLASALQTSKEVAVEDKKVEKATKTENIIPQLNIRAPYRFGVGYQYEGNNQVKTVVGEVLVSKKFSVSAGLSWLKIKPMEFFSEKMFKEKNKKDFRKAHPGQVPTAFEVANINVKPTLVQIPLTVAFRNDITSDFSYFVGAGTNVTVKAKENISFDSRFPMYGKEFQRQSFERKMDVPLFNSVNINAGIEKTWHPIVIQIEGYLFTYFKPLTPENQRTGPGVKMKLLYQIGKKM
ncbi:hypothetical protein [Dyadobacter sp. CY312]|uniref:hypothetical protein n=1 Tax=Dyadobacter sp. CY312 TaxID=2907303 RepID=UPI001F1BEBFE|nr:hypothetical protein [Dyadobacter sp. CY312]MCE7044187.1 hypothetical protein [Dyadobacter sp. CY312]